MAVNYDKNSFMGLNPILDFYIHKEYSNNEKGVKM
jgi:hypothetical protein